MYKYRISTREIKPCFKSVQIFKDQVLGHGAYGIVCKAKCEDLLCAAKTTHQILLDTIESAAKSFVRRFEQECELLSTLRHPNIVQFMGTCSDPDTGGQVLLMEMMEESLTHYCMECQYIPYHIQVNICHDVALALSYLHLNQIVHRCVCSNDILLAGREV